jgi:hypothetical protein
VTAPRLTAPSQALATLATLLLALPADLAAQQSTAARDTAQLGSDTSEEGLHHRSDVGLRIIPIGLNVLSDTGYRISLFDSDSQLLRKTYLEGGLVTGVSPAFVWAGGYVEALPIAVLQLRAQAKYMRYLGFQGFLYVPDPAASSSPAGGDSWDLGTIRDVMSEGGGTVANGLMFEGRATPRIKVGNVAFFAETRLTHIRMEVNDRYYEPYFDLMLNPTDTFFMTRPTLAYVWGEDPSRTYVLTGIRWEYTKVFGVDYSRSMPVAVVSWKLPDEWIGVGSTSIAGVGGFFFDHPNRQGTPYFAIQYSMEFGAKR